MGTLLQFIALLLIGPFIGLAVVIVYWITMQFFCGIVSFIIDLILWITEGKRGKA